MTAGISSTPLLATTARQANLSGPLFAPWIQRQREAWTAVGRANIILDNLIAQGKAKPMLMVMPLGYGEPKILEPNSGAFRDRAITDRNFDKISRSAADRSDARVESQYLVKKDRDSRAIAGLSMGVRNPC